MKNLLTLSVVLLCLVFTVKSSFSQVIFANHESTNLAEVPVEFINQAKSEFRIWYGHTSHGSQITSGMENLQTHIGSPYTFNASGSGGALSYQEVYGDLGHNGDLTWEQQTRTQLNSPGNDRNVVVWSWCGGVSDNTVGGINTYLNAMNQMEQDYPDVSFIYMTGHRDIWADANLKARNQQIRDYCIANNKILFDFADIESYNPDGTYFDYAGDDCSYYQGPGWGYLGNWAQQWCAAHPGSDLCWSCECAHSEPLNCNLKGRAFWWLLARMAGWEQQQTVFYVDKNHPNASDANPGTILEPWLTLQHAANTVQAGDSVVIREGVYYENLITQNNGNAAVGHIVFAAYPGEAVVINGTGHTSHTGIRIQNSYIKLYGLEVYNWNNTGIWVINSAFFEINNCEVHQSIYGIGISGTSHDFVLRDTEVHHFSLYGFDTSPMGSDFCHNGLFINCIAHTGRDPEQNVDGFALGHGAQNSFVFENCITYNVFDGFDISASHTTLNGCLSYDCWNTCYKLWEDEIELVNCIGYNGEMSIVQLPWIGHPTETTLRNCSFYDTGVFTIWQENSSDALNIYNTIISGGDNIGLCFQQPSAANYQGNNNLFQNNAPSRAINVGWSIEFSITDIANGTWATYSGQDSNSLTAASPEIIYLYPATYDLHLNPGSPAINAANPNWAPATDFNGNARPYGIAPDIGAFELHNGTISYQVVPSAVNFGTLFTGQTRIEEITINNTGEVDIVIDNIEALPEVFQVQDITFPLIIDDSFTFEVTFQPLEAQAVNGTLSIYSVQASNTVVPLSGTAITEPVGGFHVSGEVSGIWNQYDTIFVDGDIIVPNGETLAVTSIPGGTDCIFTGHYKFIVYGRLLLLGNKNDSIRFSSLNTSEGWFGLRFYDLNYNNMDSSRVEFCDFRYGNATGEDWDNFGGALFVYESSHLAIRDCNFQHNHADQGGGGIHIRYSNPAIERIVVMNNSAPSGGGILFWGSYPNIIRSTICSNSATNGGGLNFNGCGPGFDHCTVSSNTATTGGGVFMQDWSYPGFTNSIIWGNTSDEIHINPDGGDLIASYSDIGGAGIHYGAGNINNDPLFADPGSNNFVLTWANYPVNDETKSPCIDSGDPSSALDPDCSVTDMGAITFTAQNNHIPGGEVSGIWENFETIFVDGNIIVPQGETWQINVASGGTEVIFTGPYSVTVFGKLLFLGTPNDTISFTVQDTVTGWRGIRFEDTDVIRQGNTEIHWCSFSNAINLDPGNELGGAFRILNSSNILITHCMIFENEALNGAGIYINFSSPQISNTEIYSNTASEAGGGLFIGYESNAQLHSLNIHHNIAVGGNGGGAYIMQGSAPLFQNGSIYLNTAHSGGGVFCSSDLAVFNTLSISQNLAMGEWASGGGISCNADPLISYCNISNNISNGGGGGISCNYQNHPIIQYCTFSENQAHYGGGMSCTYGSNPQVKHTTFSNNTSTEGSGGGTYIWDYSNPEFSFVVFESNTAVDEGGAIYIQNSGGSFTNISIKNNEALSKGGGLCIREESSPEFYNVLITNNTAEWGGGVICFENSGTPVFHNLTITENTATISGGGIACDYGNPVFYSSIFWSNGADQEGDNVYLHVPESDPYFNYCLVQNGVAGFGGNGAGTNYNATRYQNCISDDPEFVDPGAGDFRLLVNSPAINNGIPDTTGFALPEIDLFGNPRIFSLIIDMGCYEFQQYGNTLNLKNYTIASGKNLCMAALETITLAGSGTTFVIESDANVVLEAGTTIFLKKGTHIHSGANALFRIEPEGNFCSNPVKLVAAIDIAPSEKTDTNIITLPGSDKSFTVYPNPGTGLFTIELAEEDLQQSAVIQIFGIKGGLWDTIRVATGTKHSFDLSGHEKGMYFLRMISGSRSETVKIILN